LVLRSPFTSLADVGAHAYPILPVRTLLRERYPLREQIGAVRVPIAVIAGAADDVVPAAQSRAVATTAGASYVELPGAGHNDVELVSGPAVIEAVVAVSA
jgi:pimeloyl-ACP methyl ester carboxylesterase